MTAARPAWPSWKSRWRLIPVLLIGAVLIVAVVQVLNPGGNQVAKEQSKSAALLGKCLAAHGTAEGHPKYSSTPVACDSPTASVKVVKVLPSTPGSPLCPTGTTGVELPYPGVRYPHIECVQAVR